MKSSKRKQQLMKTLARHRSFRELEDDPLSYYSRLSVEKQMFVYNVVVRGFTIKDAIMNAFDLPDTNKVAGLTTRLQSDLAVQNATEEMLRAVGITDEFLGQVLMDGLRANKTAALDGEVIESDVPDHGTRRGYLEIALRLKGAYKREGHPSFPDDKDDSHVKEMPAASIEDLQNKYRKKPVIDAQASEV